MKMTKTFQIFQRTYPCRIGFLDKKAQTRVTKVKNACFLHFSWQLYCLYLRKIAHSNISKIDVICKNQLERLHSIRISYYYTYNGWIWLRRNPQVTYRYRQLMMISGDQRRVDFQGKFFKIFGEIEITSNLGHKWVNGLWRRSRYTVDEDRKCMLKYEERQYY